MRFPGLPSYELGQVSEALTAHHPTLRPMLRPALDDCQPFKDRNGGRIS